MAMFRIGPKAGSLQIVTCSGVNLGTYNGTSKVGDYVTYLSSDNPVGSGTFTNLTYVADLPKGTGLDHYTVYKLYRCTSTTYSCTTTSACEIVQLRYSQGDIEPAEELIIAADEFIHLSARVAEKYTYITGVSSAYGFTMSIMSAQLYSDLVPYDGTHLLAVGRTETLSDLRVSEASYIGVNNAAIGVPVIVKLYN